MRFGVCAPISDAVMMAKIGFDYLEVNASGLAAMTDEEFEAFCAENAAAPIHAEAANVLFPGTIRLTGEEADMETTCLYIEKILSRLGRAGVRTAVFGSSGSRRVPDGFPMEKAWDQLVKVGKILAQTAEKYNVMIALEPLRKAETNMINLQSEGAALVKEVDHPHFKLLCDFYHLTQEGGTPADVEACGEQLIHIHIAKPDDRKAMYPEDGCDYAGFFGALRRAGYDGRISFEGDAGEREKTLPAALRVMKQI